MQFNGFLNELRFIAQNNTVRLQNLSFSGELRAVSADFFEKHILHIDTEKFKSTFYNVRRIVSSWSRTDISPSFSRKGSHKSLLF